MVSAFNAVPIIALTPVFINLTKLISEDVQVRSMIAKIMVVSVVHAIGYSLTYFKHIDHKKANGIILGEYIKFLKNNKLKKIDTLLKTMKIKTASEFKSILNDLIGTKLELTELELENYSEKALKTKNISNGIILVNKKDILELIIKSLQMEG